MRRFLTLFLFIPLVILTVPDAYGQKRSYRIGFSQCVGDDSWRETMQREMQIEVSLYPEFELITTDAGGKSEQQVRDVKKLIESDIDLLIISPNESEPLTKTVEQVYNLGIPVVVIDRQVNSDSWTAYIGADNNEIGYRAGIYAASRLKGVGSIMEITGLPGSSPARERHKGFVSAISEFPGLKITESIPGNWIWADGNRVMDSLLLRDYRPDLVFCHNDYMAAGAYEAAVEFGLDTIIIIGIDGLPGNEGGIQYVIDGKIDATWLYPTGGDKAIETARKILLGQPYKRVTKLQTLQIDQRNANTLRLQNLQLASLQEKIERQRIIAGNYRKQITNLRIGAILISIFTAIVLILIGLLVRAFRAKQHTNTILGQKNSEIQEQNETLQKISEQLEIATQQKLRFFTNISHEFRTPLTLMAGPLESLITRDDLPDDTKKQFEMMYRNSLRLLRLINQIMDFRKLENHKMLLHAGHYDLVAFITGIKENFEILAGKKNIDLKLNCQEKKLHAWFDMDKMDKVMFNLLSNAFKFTPEGGTIAINLRTTEKVMDGETRKVAEIVISDNGRGMSEEHVQRIFERFYQIEQQREGNYFPGTGLGLSLSKSFIELHSGAIEVESRKTEGTRFMVYLQLGEQHLKEIDKITAQDYDSVMGKNAAYISEELQYFPAITEEETDDGFHPVGGGSKDFLILIVEDNSDLRKYIREILVDNYDIVTARDGMEAWEIVQRDLPDLVISDIMMPRMNGLELTQHIKKELKTCHIPVILLTAKTSIENKLEGLEAGADSYIPKPFNERHLLVRVRKLMQMRKRINEHYKEHLSFENLESPVGRMDKLFLDRASKIIRETMQNSEFGVEELSREIGMSRVHLYRKIKQITGLSVSEYIRSVKLLIAKNMLRKGELTISEVAYATGFSNPSYFTKCFRSQFNQSPSEYIEQFGDS